MQIEKIILLLLIWFLFWGLYNFVLMKKGLSTEKGGMRSSLIFLLSVMIVLFISGVYEEISILIFIYLCSIVFLFSIVTQHREIGRLSNSIFQMTWFFTLSFFVNNNFLILGLIFFVTHIPILFVKHIGIKAKLLIIGGSFIGGLFIAWILLTIDYPYNWILSILTHYTFYILLRPIDRKYKMNILH